jgi:phage-related protein
MRIAAPLIGIGLLVAIVAACSEKAQDQAQNTANVIAADVSNTADDVENAANRLSNKAEAAFNHASNEADNAADATGKALENAGRDLRK